VKRVLRRLLLNQRIPLSVGVGLTVLCASFWPSRPLWQHAGICYGFGCLVDTYFLDQRPRQRALPKNAEFLFYLFLDPQNCDALVGDLEERYRLIREKFGRRRANFWYWTQALQSVGPIVWAWGKRTLRTLSGIAALVEFYRRIR
jgi:hypothetical protein